MNLILPDSSEAKVPCLLRADTKSSQPSGTNERVKTSDLDRSEAEVTKQDVALVSIVEQ